MYNKVSVREKSDAELDAYYAKLYGLNHKQLRYILDPADLTPRELEDILDPWEEVVDPLGPAGYNERRTASDFPGETFRVLKEREIKQFGEYRTRRLVLEAWDRLDASGELPHRDGSEPALEVPERETIVITPAQSAPEPRPVPARVQPPAQVKPSAPKEVEPPADQPTLTDFGLYKCETCGKMVMGYEKDNHEREKHVGMPVEWKKMR